MEAWYAIHHMREFVRDQHDLLLPTSLRNKGKDLANTTDEELRAEFARIQQTIGTIIHKDVCNSAGLFFYGHTPPCNDDVEVLLSMSRDGKPFNMLEGCRPFPPKPRV